MFQVNEADVLAVCKQIASLAKKDKERMDLVRWRIWRSRPGRGENLYTVCCCHPSDLEEMKDFLLQNWDIEPMNVPELIKLIA